MATIGLKIESPGVPTDLGSLLNTFIQVVTVEAEGDDEDGDQVVSVLFDVYESRAKYDEGDRKLITAGFSQRRRYAVDAAIELSQTSIHQALKVVLEAEGYSVSEESN